MSYVIQIVGDAGPISDDGHPSVVASEWDGAYIAGYDPMGEDGRGVVDLARSRDGAREFPTSEEAQAFIDMKSSNGGQPLRRYALMVMGSADGAVEPGHEAP